MMYAMARRLPQQNHTRRLSRGNEANARQVC